VKNNIQNPKDTTVLPTAVLFFKGQFFEVNFEVNFEVKMDVIKRPKHSILGAKSSTLGGLPLYGLLLGSFLLGRGPRPSEFSFYS